MPGTLTCVGAWQTPSTQTPVGEFADAGAYASYINRRITRMFYLQIKNDDIKMRTVLPGVLSEPNGIALLIKNGFDAQIETDANAILNWISDYLVHPREEPNIF